MFGSRYFGNRYFGGRYWGHVGAAAIITDTPPHRKASITLEDRGAGAVVEDRAAGRTAENRTGKAGLIYEADLTIPANAITWKTPMDPGEYKDYIAEFAAEMDADADTIVTPTVTLSAEATDAGLEVDTVVNPPAKVNDDKDVRIYFQVASGQQSDAKFRWPGVELPVIVKIVTTAGRTFERTFLLPVTEQ